MALTGQQLKHAIDPYFIALCLHSSLIKLISNIRFAIVRPIGRLL